MSRHGASSERGRRGRSWRPDAEAVTPVVGTLLILSIVVVSMAGILSWGVPAIQGLQAHAEFQSVQTQMIELNSELRNLRDPQNTRIATISMSGGTIQFTTGDRWAVAVIADPEYDSFRLANFDDAGNPSVVSVVGLPVGKPTVASMAKFVGGVQSNLVEQGCVVNCDLVPDPGTASYDLTRDTTRIQITEDSVVKAEAWIINVGRITYSQDGGRNHNHLEMGASVIQQANNYYMRSSPTIKDPDFDADDRQFFVRVLEVKAQNQSVSGRGEFSMLVNLVDNHGVSKSRPSFDNAWYVRFQIEGDLSESFCNHLLLRSPSYKFRGEGYNLATPTTCADGDANVLYDPGQTFSFALSHAEVNGYARSA